MLFQKVFVQLVAVVGLVADEFFRSFAEKETTSTNFTSWGEALARQTAIGRPEVSAMAMTRLPLPRFVQPTEALLFSFFGRNKAAVCLKCLLDVQSAAIL
jgi:hypothetical protein